MEKIALLPGGFKPPHAGHYNAAKWLAVNTDTDTVIVKVGAGVRDGITREMSLKLWNLYKSADPNSSKIEIRPSKHNSPVKDAYDFIENDAPEGSTVYLAMGEKEIKTNDQRFANIGKFADPKGIKFETKLVPPQAGGISGEDMRGFIMADDQYSFFENLDKLEGFTLTPEQKEEAWQIVTTAETSEWKPGDPVSFEMWTSDWNLKSFGKEYDSNFKNREDAVAHFRPDKAEDWAFKSFAYVAKKIPGFGTELEENLFKLLRLDDLEEDLYNPNDHVLDYMKSSEWKAGMPDGHKEDIPRSYKYQRGGIYGRMYEQGNQINNTTSTVLINDIPVNLETMNTPDQQMKGMMGRDSLEGGMLFPYDQVQRRDFHMQDCKMSLDIIFINQGKIDNIHNNCPPCKQNNCPNYSGLADNVLEFPGGYCKKNNVNVGDEVNLNINPNIPNLNEIKYGSQYLLAQYKEEIQAKHGHQQYRNLQTLMSQKRDESVAIWLKSKGYIKEQIEETEASVFSKEWWLDIINEHILTEGGAAGHMAHPFDLPDVTSGKDLKDLFVKAANSLQSNPGSIKIDGVNSSIRLIDLDGKKQFVMDRGSKKPLDIKGITKDDLGDRFKTKDGSPHGMVKVGGEVLDMFNEALPSLENDLKKLGAWDDPNILFNMEYVSGKTNVQDYDTNFIAIHGLNKIESKEVMGAKKMLIKRSSSEILYDKSDLQSMLDNLTPVAEKNGFEVYGSVPTEFKGKPNFGAALNTLYTVKTNEGDKTQSLDKWLSELNDIPKKDSIFINGLKKDAVSKLIYTSLLDGGNIDELFRSEEDKEKAIGGFVTYLATEKLGDEILKVLDSPMGSADKHEGVVIRDEKIANVPFKITGKFILGGMYSDF